MTLSDFTAPPFPIRLSSPQTEGMLQVSKWVKIQALLGKEEMEELLFALGPIHFLCVSELVKPEEALIPIHSFQEKYGEYVHLLQQGKVPNPGDFRRYFSSAMTTTLDAFYAIAA